MGNIYRILNVKTNAFYIGSSINLHKRWKEHKNDLKKGIHHSVYMQRSYNKHGIDSFKYEILASCPREYLVSMEQWFINSLRPKYNMSKDVIRPSLGRKLTKKQKEAIRKKHIGNKYNLGRKAPLETKEKMSKLRFGQKSSQKTIIKLKNSTTCSPVVQMDLQGNVVKIYKSINGAAEELGILRSAISAVCRGKQKTCYGYKWKYLDLMKKVNRRVIDINTGVIYTSITEAANILGIHRNSIGNALNNRSKSHQNLKYF